MSVDDNTSTSLPFSPDGGQVNERLLFALARARVGGMPQWRVASRAGVSPSLLSFWVHGQRVPTRSQAEDVAAVLGYPVDQLFSRVRKAGDLEESAERGRA
jgi:hypothetical protein